MNDWGGLESRSNEFVANFRAADAYLQGCQKTAPESEERLRRVLRAELQPASGHLQAIRDRVDAVHSRLDLIVEKLLDLDQRSELTWEQVREWAKKSPEAEKAKIRYLLQA